MTRLEAIRRALIGEVFALAQPDRGDVFGWVDDHAEEIAAAIERAIGDQSPIGPGRETGPVHESPGAGTAIAQRDAA